MNTRQVLKQTKCVCRHLGDFDSGEEREGQGGHDHQDGADGQQEGAQAHTALTHGCNVTNVGNSLENLSKLYNF